MTAAFKNPETYVTLCTLIGTSKNDKLKEYAALVLRKKFYKRNSWMNLAQEIRQSYVTFYKLFLVNLPFFIFIFN